MARLQSLFDQLPLAASWLAVVAQAVLADKDMAGSKASSVKRTLAGTLQADEDYQLHEDMSPLMQLRFRRYASCGYGFKGTKSWRKVPSSSPTRTVTDQS